MPVAGEGAVAAQAAAAPVAVVPKDDDQLDQRVRHVAAAPVAAVPLAAAPDAAVPLAAAVPVACDAQSWLALEGLLLTTEANTTAYAAASFAAILIHHERSPVLAAAVLALVPAVQLASVKLVI